MPNRLLKTVFAISIGLASTCSFAEKLAPTRRSITIMAPVTCLEWLRDESAAKSSDNDLINSFSIGRHRSWALGLITGLNAASGSDKNDIENIDSQLLLDWIGKYCQNDEKKDVYDAVAAIFVQLRTVPKSRNSTK